MTAVARDWLPAGALRTPAVRAALDAAIARWSVRWFGGRTVAIASFREAGVKRLSSSGAGKWRSFAPGLFLDGREEARQAIARHALQAPADAIISEGDARLIEDFAESITADLVGELVGAFGVKRHEPAMAAVPPQGDDTSLLCLAPDNGSFALDLVVDGATLAGLRKAQCAPLEPARAEPLGMLTALGETVVPFRAVLGRARLSARELSDLDPDDVVIFDTALTAQISLVAEGTGRALATATLSREGEKLALRATAFEGQAF